MFNIIRLGLIFHFWKALIIWCVAFKLSSTTCTAMQNGKIQKINLQSYVKSDSIFRDLLSYRHVKERRRWEKKEVCLGFVSQKNNFIDWVSTNFVSFLIESASHSWDACCALKKCNTFVQKKENSKDWNNFCTFFPQKLTTLIFFAKSWNVCTKWFFSQPLSQMEWMLFKTT